MINPFDLVEQQKEFSQELPLEVEMAFRKLQKRDLSTKLKGLEELISFLTRTDNLFEALKGTFEERFMQCFNKGMVDPERRVRLSYAQLLKIVYEKEKRLLQKGLLFAWLGATFDPYAAVAGILQRLPTPPLNPGMLGKEAVEWIEFRAEQLCESYEKDAANVQAEHEKREMQTLGKLAKELAFARAINILAHIQHDYTLPKSFEYCKQSSLTVKQSLIKYYTKKEIKCKELIKEKSPELLPSIFHYLIATEGEIGEELCVNALVAGLADDAQLHQLVKQKPTEWLWSCILKIKILYDERKIKAMLVLLLKHSDKQVDVIKDVFEKAVIQGAGPFGLLEATDSLELFPTENVQSFVLSSLQRGEVHDPRTLSVINASIESAEIPANLQVTLKMAQKVPKLRKLYFKTLDVISISDLDLITGKEEFDFLFPKVRSEDVGIITELVNRFCHLMNQQQAESAMQALSNEHKHLLWAKALEAENVFAAIPAFEYFSTYDSIPESFFLNTVFCQAVLSHGLLHKDYALFSHFSCEFVNEYVLPAIDKDCNIQEYYDICEHLNITIKSDEDSDADIYDLPVMPSHVLESSADPKLGINMALKYLIRCHFSSHRSFAAEVALLFVDDYYEEYAEEQCPEFLDTFQIRQAFIQDLYKLTVLSQRHGNYCSMLYFECSGEKIDLGTIEHHEHHQIVDKAHLLRYDGLEVYRENEGDIYIYEWNSALCLAQLAVTSDIIHDLIVEEDERNLLFLLPNAKLTQEFWGESILTYVESLLLKRLPTDIDLVCNAVHKVQVLQTGNVLSAINDAFQKGCSSSALCNCMRIYLMSKQADLPELILKLVAYQNINLLKLARFLLFLQQDTILSGEDISEHSMIKAIVASEGNLLLRCDMLLGLAEGCKGAGTNPQLEGKNLNDLGDLFAQHFLPALLLASDNLSNGKDDDFATFDVESYSRRKGKDVFRLNLLYRSLRLYPSIYRSTSNLPSVIEKIICPAIIKRQLEKLKLKPKELSISSSTTMTKVTCEYRFEDALLKLELVIPPKFPLQCPEVSLPTQSNISGSRARTALLAAHSIFLSNDGADVGKAIDNWRKTLDASFSGTESCAVCYCVMCPSDRSLPGPTCKTCKHKFHAACLYKWFKTSSNSTCPMCRSLF